MSIGQSAPLTRDFAREKIDAVAKEFKQESKQLEESYRNTRKAGESARSDDRYQAAVTVLASYQKTWDRWRIVLFPALAAVLVCGLLVFLFLAVSRQMQRAVPYYLGMAACTALAVMVVVNWGPQTRSKTNRTVDEVALAPAGGGQNFDELKPGDEATLPGAERDGAAAEKADNLKLNDRLGAAPVPMATAAPALPPGLARNPAYGKAAADAVKADGAGNPKWKGQDKAAGKALEAMVLEKQQNAAQVPAAAAALGGGRGAAAGKPQAGAAPDYRPEARAKRDGDEQARFGNGLPAARPAPAALPMAPGAAGPMMQAKKGEMLRERADQMLDRRRQAEKLAGDNKQPLMLAPLVVRQYAHTPRHQGNTGVRSDDAETLFFHPVIVLPSPSGKAEVSFNVGDSVTRFQATAFAHTLDGRLGTGTLLFESKLPFTLAPKTPLEVTAGDRITLPVGIANNTGDTRAVELSLEQHRGLALEEGRTREEFFVQGEAARRSTGSARN